MSGKGGDKGYGAIYGIKGMGGKDFGGGKDFWGPYGPAKGDAGYAQGFVKGHESGFGSGKEAGFGSGKEAGFAKGKEVGFAMGKDQQEQGQQEKVACPICQKQFTYVEAHIRDKEYCKALVETIRESHPEIYTEATRLIREAEEWHLRNPGV